MDRRVRYTKMFLKESLIELLQEKPLSRITVTELCQKAEINRSTYYTYYKDPYEQLETMKTEFFENINLIVSEYFNENSKTHSSTILKLIQYYKENKDLFIALNKYYGYAIYEEELFSVTKSSIILSLKGQGIQLPEDKADYMLHFVIMGCDSIIYNWLSKDYKKYTEEQILDLLYTLSFSCLKQK